MLLRPFCTLLLKKAGGGGGGGNGGPTVLTADLDLYVRTTGNDANDGLANTDARAFKTITGAVQHLRSHYNMAGFTANINVADGTYNEAVSVVNVPNCIIHFKGSASAIWRGNGGTALTVHGSFVCVTGFTFGGGGTTEGFVEAFNGSEVRLLGGHVFAATTSFHVIARRGGSVWFSGAYSITGGGAAHLGIVESSSVFVAANFTVTLTGTPAFTRFILCGRGSIFTCSDFSSYGFSGSATGIRYEVAGGSTLFLTNSAGSKGANFFPGSTAGTVATGGTYAG